MNDTNDRQDQPEVPERRAQRPPSDLIRLGEIPLRMPGQKDGTSSQKMMRKPEVKPEECTCRMCGGKFMGEVHTYHLLGRLREWQTSECPGCQVKREVEEKAEQEHLQEIKIRTIQERWRLACNLPQGLHADHFDALDPEYQPKIAARCRGWAEGFNLDKPQGYPSLFLYSQVPGVGKTTFMACIAHHIIETWFGDPEHAVARPVRMESGPGLVLRIRATYNLPARDTTHERETDVLNDLIGVPLLMLDDVGKEPPSAFTRQTYWYIISQRIGADLPIVLNSRLPFSGDDSLRDLMGPDTVDRLYGMCQGKFLELKGTSYRRLKAIP